MAASIEMAQQGSASRPTPFLGGEEGVFRMGSARLPGWGMDGKTLHGKEGGVKPEMWCVTRNDLKQLRQDVREAISTGMILPSERDPFDIADDKMGPNMYTVVEQYIKPLTREAGGMSWALLQHPCGIECNVFVTHAWAEGIFEFIDKLLVSWPRGKQAAWICVLANPQNLDISGLISEPRSSPFALALDSASHVVVVPTQRTSIYSRIWCVYEAYLAMNGTKVILTARPSVLGEITKCLLVVLVVFMAPYLLKLAGLGEISFGIAMALLSPMLFIFLILMGVNLCATRPKRATNIVGAFCLGLYFWGGIDFGLDANAVFGVLVVLVFFAASEADRVLSIATKQEQDMLKKAYSGVENAQSSSEADKTNILQDIGAELSAVEDSVQVLQRTGMSTAALRKASSLGLQIKGARDVKWAFASLLLSWPVVVVLMTYRAWLDPSPPYISWPARVVTVVSCASVLFCAWRYAKAEEDEQAFISSALTKGWAVTIITADIPHPLAGIMRSVPGEIGLLDMFLVTLLCAFGRLALMEVPLVGPTVARVLAPGVTLRDAIITVAVVCLVIFAKYAAAW